jgi:hypothetical protein
VKQLLLLLCLISTWDILRAGFQFFSCRYDSKHDDRQRGPIVLHGISSWVRPVGCISSSRLFTSFEAREREEMRKKSTLDLGGFESTPLGHYPLPTRRFGCWNDYKWCERLQKFIGKKITATQKLNAHHCKRKLKKFFFACMRKKYSPFFFGKETTELSTVICCSCG